MFHLHLHNVSFLSHIVMYYLSYDLNTVTNIFRNKPNYSIPKPSYSKCCRFLNTASIPQHNNVNILEQKKSPTKTIEL